MEEIGLFPLPIVLVPTEQVPLHIFEGRYQELIGECLETEIEFGLVLEDDHGLREVGTRARVTGVLTRFPDGRLNIAIEGGGRFRLLHETERRSFRTAEIEPLEDEDGINTAEAAERALELYRRVAELAEADAEDFEAGSRSLSFELAGRVDFGTLVKQELLESRSEPERLGRVIELLEQACETLAQRRELRDRAAGNGKVSM